MPVYAVTGNLGSGKTLVCVGKARDALRRGVRVATNLDLRLELLHPDARPGQLVRLSDHPNAAELRGLGLGNITRNESLNSVLILDEAGAWLNSRGWQDKDRHAVIEWMLHARKLGWDVFLIVQDIALIDKQIRVAFVEHLVRCRRLDRFSVPFLGAFFSMVGGALRLPQVHIANVFYGTAPGSVCVERWVYRGRELWGAYETRQIFRGDSVNSGPSSVIPPSCARWLRPGQRWARLQRVKDGWFLRLLFWLWPLSPEEAEYRAFRVVESYPDTLQTRPSLSFSEWCTEAASSPGSVAGHPGDGDAAGALAVA